MEEDQRLKKAISSAFASGYQIDKEAFSLLKELAKERNPEEVLEKILIDINDLPEKPLFVTKQMILKAVNEIYENKVEEESYEVAESVGRIFKPLSKEFPSELEILEDPTGKIGSKCSINDLLKYFEDRFKKIESFLRKRLDVKDAISVREALNSSLNTKIKVIGIVTSIKERREVTYLQIEDFEAVATVLVSSRANRGIRQKAERILLDQIVCIEGIKGKNDLIIAIDFINPDIPERKPRKAEKAVYAALISDLHIGSKKFQLRSFNKFLRWLKGQEGNNRQRSMASRVKYIVIAGDLVDGIGIYPNQKEELSISDIYEQYAFAAKLLQQIPEYVEVIIIPGNHDATRQALPQPAIRREYAEPVYEARKVVMIGNPAKIRLNGVELLVYHGRSLDDVISSVPDVMYKNLNETIPIAMRYLLKTRHLAPIYGGKTPLAPEIRDFLVIDSVPDVFHAGHVHMFGYEMYRGTLIVNSGSWQSKTSFQEKMGLNPTYGVAPILNLKSLRISAINFSS